MKYSLRSSSIDTSPKYAGDSISAKSMLTVLLRSMLSNCLGFMSPNRHRDCTSILLMYLLYINFCWLSRRDSSYFWKNFLRIFPSCLCIYYTKNHGLSQHSQCKRWSCQTRYRLHPCGEHKWPTCYFEPPQEDSNPYTTFLLYAIIITKFFIMVKHP